jgi:dTDP-4-dehydrorhamnose 3,5-epimerase
VDLLEYQGKQVFRAFGIAIPDGKPAKSPAKARDVAEKLGGRVVVKAQVRVGGRGKAGGVKLADTPQHAEEAASQILGMDIKGHVVREVLIERAGEIAAEYYVSFMLDRSAKKYLGMCSSKGGMDIEQVAQQEPEYLAKVHVDPLVGFRPFHATQMTSGGRIPREHARAVGDFLNKLYNAFTGSDAMLVEVNPLVIDGEGNAIALDAKVSLDENAAYRHPDFAKYVDTRALPKQERKAKELGRGIHSVRIPPGQAKYVTCVRGSLRDIVVDLRIGSPTFGEHRVNVLDADSGRSVYVPEGGGHGFLALSDDACICYVVSTTYVPGTQIDVNPLDPDLDLPWDCPQPPLISDKDAKAPTVAEAVRAGMLPRFDKAGTS